MKAAFKFYIFLILLYLAFAGVAYVVLKFTQPGIGFPEFTVLLTGGLIITAIVFFIFFRGLQKDGPKQVINTFLSIGLKFLLYLALLGLYALIYEELSIPFLVSFFVIYLSFTSYLLLTFVSLLKHKKQTVPDDKENL